MNKFLLTLADQELTFNVSNDHINKLLNSMNPTNKVAPFFNFLMATIESEQKDLLKAVIKDNCLATLELGGALLEAVSPNLELTVKKLES